MGNIADTNNWNNWKTNEKKFTIELYMDFVLI